MAVVTVAFEDLDTWLSNQPNNTIDTPYELNITGLTVNSLLSSFERDTLGNVLKNKKKYVDLSATILPSELTSLESSFLDCRLVVAPVIPNSVKKLRQAFQNTCIITAPVLPNRADLDLYRTFCNCLYLVNAPVLPNGITSLTETFSGCKSLVNAPVLPNGITSLTDTFSDCISLVNAPAIPNTVLSMTSTFDGCTSLVPTLILPNSVTSLTTTFRGCTSFVNAPVIPNSVTSMAGTFISCTSLVNAPVIPSGVTIMSDAFANCTSLVNAPVIPSGVTSIKGTFYKCPLITAPELPDSVLYLDACFRDCTSLKTVPNVPKNVQSMGTKNNLKGTFEGCTALEEITLFEADLESLVNNNRAYNAFSGCTSLTKIGLKNNVLPPSESDDWHIFSLNFGASTVEGKVYDKDGTSHTIEQTSITKSDLKLPILTDELWFPTGYTDAQLEAIIQKMITYRYGVFNKETIPPDEKTFVLQADNPAHFRSNLPFVKESDVVDTVASGNLHSVTSNAVAQSLNGKANQVKLIGVSGATVTEMLKNALDLLSEKTEGSYNGLINPQSGTNYNYNTFVVNHPNYNFEVGLVEAVGGNGVYYISREQVNQETPVYIIKRVDMPDISAQQEATIVPSRFAPDYTAWCHWWRCGRVVTVNIYTSGVYSKIAVGEIIFTGLPKPIANSMPQTILNWAGQNSFVDAIYYVDNLGNLCVQGGSSYTDTVIYGLGTLTYVTSDD